MAAYLGFVIRFRWAILALIALVTTAAGWSLSHGIASTSVGRLLLGEHPDYRRYLQLAEQFGDSDVMVAAFEQPDLLGADALGRLERACKAMARLPGVRSVRSVLDVQHIKGETDRLSVATYAREARQEPKGKGEFLALLARDPLASGLLVSRDGRHTAIAVELEAAADMPAENGPEIVVGIRDALAEAGLQRDGVHVVGVPANIAAMVSETRFNLGRLFPIVCLVLLLTVWIMFRRLWPVAVSLAVTSIAVVWTMGFSVLLDRHINILTSAIPTVILIIAFSDVIHLCSAYLLELSRGHDKQQAVFLAGAEVGKACLLTSATTFAGFLSLSLIPAPAFRHLGVVLAAGVSVALLIAVTLVPILFWTMPEPRPWRTGATGRVQGLLDGFLHTVCNTATRRARTMLLLFAALGAAAVYGLFHLTIETDFQKRLAADHPVRVGGDYVRRHLAGANALNVFVEAPARDGLLDEALFRKIAGYQEALQELGQVERAVSLVDLVERIHQEMTAGDSQAERLPKTPGALSQYLLLFEMSGGSDLERLVDFNRKTMRITLYLPEEGVIHTRDTGKRALALARKHLAGAARVEVSGLNFLMGQWLDHILEGQRRGLALAFFSIALMMIIGLRSVRVGLWSMIPNVLPVMVLGGFSGLAWDQVDSDLIAVAMIAIGIGVDDTVHFLMRLRIEIDRGRSTDEAIEATFHYSGRAIVITTVILVAGFLPFALSDYFSINMLGTLLPMTLMVALAADLFLVPALVRLGLIRF